MFDWKRYLNLAEALLIQGTEDYFRCAISRAYYAAFGSARNKAGISYSSNQGPEIHEEVRAAFRAKGTRAARSIAELLLDLRRQRNTADYDDNTVIQKPTADRAIEKAKLLFTALDTTAV